MIVTLTREEMLRRRRIAAGLEPFRTDCTVERTDGIDIDAILAQDMRQAYLRLLDTAPAHLVAVNAVAATTESLPSTGKGTLIKLPQTCRRVFTVRLSGWEVAAHVAPASEALRIIAQQLNPYTRATAAAPVACLAPGCEAGTENAVLAWPAGTRAQISAAVDPGEDLYTLDESALPTLLS